MFGLLGARLWGAVPMQFHGDDKNGSGLVPSSRTPLLLHACCGPCSIEPVELLRREGFEPTICWTNPNIQPVAEHDRRLATLRAWAAERTVPAD